MDALSSWLEMAPGSGSSLASSKNSRFSFPRRERAAFRDFSLRCACRLGGRRGGGVSGAARLRGPRPGGAPPSGPRNRAGRGKWIQHWRWGQNLRVNSAPGRGDRTWGVNKFWGEGGGRGEKLNVG